MAIPIRMIKPWRPLTPEEADKVAGNLGVYQLANDNEGRLPPLNPEADGRGLGKISPG